MYAHFEKEKKAVYNLIQFNFEKWHMDNIFMASPVLSSTIFI